jgi:hypothetical protein
MNEPVKKFVVCCPHCGGELNLGYTPRIRQKRLVNAGKAWTPECDAELKHYIQLGKHKRDIQALMGRSKQSIETRVSRLKL